MLDYKYESADEKLNLFRLTRYKNLLPQISNRINFITLHAVILKQFWVKSSIVMKMVKDLTKSSSIFGPVLLETYREFLSCEKFGRINSRERSMKKMLIY